MTDPQLDREALRALAEAATPGPWAATGHCGSYSGRADRGYDKTWTYHILQANTGRRLDYFAVNTDPAEPKPAPPSNCAFIAAADPSTVLALLARLDEAETLLADAVFAQDVLTREIDELVATTRLAPGSGCGVKLGEIVNDAGARWIDARAFLSGVPSTAQEG